MSFQKKLRIDRMAKMSKEKRPARKQGEAIVMTMRREHELKRENSVPREEDLEGFQSAGDI